MSRSVLVSCEYATCAVPEAQRALFAESEEVLQSEQGWEPGALNLGQAFAMSFRTPLVHGEITRLLIDLEADEENRWSRFSEGLSEQTRERFERRMWVGYRETLRQRINEDLRRHDAVVHIAVHTGGVADGRVVLRIAEAGGLAAGLADAWAKAARTEVLDIGRATGDMPGGLLPGLVGEFPADRYAAVRLEVAAGYFLLGKPMRWDACKKALIAGLRRALEEA